MIVEKSIRSSKLALLVLQFDIQMLVNQLVTKFGEEKRRAIFCEGKHPQIFMNRIPTTKYKWMVKIERGGGGYLLSRFVMILR